MGPEDYDKIEKELEAEEMSSRARALGRELADQRCNNAKHLNELSARWLESEKRRYSRQLNSRNGKWK